MKSDNSPPALSGDLRPGSEDREVSLHRHPKMNIALILRWFYPQVTGIITQHMRYAPFLASENIYFVVDTLQTPEMEHAPSLVNEIRIFRHSVDLKALAGNSSNLDLELFTRAIRRWEDEGQYPDVIILFSHSRALLPGILWARKRGIPCVFSASNYPEGYGSSLYLRLKHYMASWVMMRFYESVYVYSGLQGKVYEQIGASKAQITVIPFGVDGEQFRAPAHDAEKQALRRRLELPEDCPLVVYLGSVVERKGADLLLKAWETVSKAVPSAVLVFVGPYGNRDTFVDRAERESHHAFLKRFEQELQQLENRESVILTGVVQNPQEYLRAGDLFAFPSRSEGFGGVVLEAMASELPCVLTPYEGFPEVEFGREGSEHVKVGFQPDEIAATIIELLRSPEERSRLGRNARRFVCEELGLDKVARKMANALRRIAAPPRSRKGK